MRYVISIIAALIGAALAFAFFASPLADWLGNQYKYDSSDDVESLNQMVFIVVNLVGVIIGWTIGWAIGGQVERRQDAKHHVD